MNCQEQILEQAEVWKHTVWPGVGVPAEFVEACPSVEGKVAEPTEGMIIEV